jgi:PhnB protein
MNKDLVIHTSIAPWLTVNDGKKAVAFYAAAFNAIESYHLEDIGVFIVRLNINGAEIWVNENADSSNINDSNVRMILTVSNPEELFNKAIQAGAKEIFPVGEDHGWKLGRIEDPFGLHWEIGHPVGNY